MPRAETNHKIKLRKILRPTGLSTSQYLGSRKILKVFVISYNIDGGRRSLEIVPPNSESMKDSKQLFIMSVIIQLRTTEGTGVKRDRVNITRVCLNRQNSAKRVI